MNFDITEENGEYDVKCKAEKVGNDVIIHAPNLKLIKELVQQHKEKVLKEKVLKDKEANK